MVAKAKSRSMTCVVAVCVASEAFVASCADGNTSGANALSSHARAGRNAYEVERLVSDDTTVVPAEHQDPLLVNAWGLAASPTGPWWVANADSNSSTLYDGEGVKQTLEVTVAGGPTGLVFHGGAGLLVNGFASRFIYATESGTLVAWAPQLQPNTVAVAVVNNSASEASYKGL